MTADGVRGKMNFRLPTTDWSTAHPLARPHTECGFDNEAEKEDEEQDFDVEAGQTDHAA